MCNTTFTQKSYICRNIKKAKVLSACVQYPSNYWENKKQRFRNVLSSPLDDIVYTVDIDEEGNHHNFQAHSIEDLPEDYLPTEDSYYEFEQPCPLTP